MKRWGIVILLMGLSMAAEADTSGRTVVVQGQGTVAYQPDRASVALSIVARSKDVGTAQQSAAEVAARVLKLAERLGLERRRVDTTAATVRPEYRWNRDEEQQELVGYVAERQMDVELEDLSRLGDLVEGAVAAGVNQVSSPDLYSSRERDIYREALAAAAADARRNAEALAGALGATVGEVVSIHTSSASTPTPMPGVRMAMAAESDAAQTYNAGERSHRTEVQVVFALQ
jgi:uncharacterized protein YggE